MATICVTTTKLIGTKDLNDVLDKVGIPGLPIYGYHDDEQAKYSAVQFSEMGNTVMLYLGNSGGDTPFLPVPQIEGYKALEPLRNLRRSA